VDLPFGGDVDPRLSYLEGVIRAAGIVAASLALLGAGSAKAPTLQPVGSFEQPTYVPGGPQYLPEPQATFVGIKPQRRRVERGKTAVLTVWVSPCSNRKGDTVVLLRNGRRNGSRFLSRACTARFLRRVHRNTAFVAATYRNNEYLAGKSRLLKIRIESRHRASRQR
jgi:hypothetical protein